MSISVNDRAKKYRLNNPEKVSESKKKSWYKNHEENIIKSREKYQEHKEIRQKDSLRRYHLDPKAKSNNRLKRLFGITLDEYNKLSESQNHLCAICNNPETMMDNKQLAPRKLAVDHCHETKSIRGLLCFNCNIGLGKFKDSIAQLNQAIEYLKKYTI